MGADARAAAHPPPPAPGRGSTRSSPRAWSRWPRSAAGPSAARCSGPGTPGSSPWRSTTTTSWPTAPSRPGVSSTWRPPSSCVPSGAGGERGLRPAQPRRGEPDRRRALPPGRALFDRPAGLLAAGWRSPPRLLVLLGDHLPVHDARPRLGRPGPPRLAPAPRAARAALACRPRPRAGGRLPAGSSSSSSGRSSPPASRRGSACGGATPSASSASPRSGAWPPSRPGGRRPTWPRGLGRPLAGAGAAGDERRAGHLGLRDRRGGPAGERASAAGLQQGDVLPGGLPRARLLPPGGRPSPAARAGAHRSSSPGWPRRSSSTCWSTSATPATCSASCPRCCWRRAPGWRAPPRRSPRTCCQAVGGPAGAPPAPRPGRRPGRAHPAVPRLALPRR